MPSRIDASGGRRAAGSGSPWASRLNGCGPCVCGSTAIASRAGGLATATRRPASVSASSVARMPDSGQTSSTRGSVSCVHVSSRPSAGGAEGSQVACARHPCRIWRRVHVGRVDGLGREPDLDRAPEPRMKTDSRWHRRVVEVSYPILERRALLRSGSRSGSPRMPMASRPAAADACKFSAGALRPAGRRDEPMNGRAIREVRGQGDLSACEHRRPRRRSIAPRRHDVGTPEERFDGVYGRIVGSSQDVPAERSDPVDPATDVGEDDDLHLFAAQDDLTQSRHPAIDIARSGRSRKGASTAGRFDSGRTSGCRSIPSDADMNARRALDAGPQVGIAPRELVPQRVVGQDDPVLDVRREVLGAGGRDDVDLEGHPRSQLDGRAAEDRRAHPFVEVELVTRVEEDPEERVAQMLVDDGLQLTSGDADAEGAVPRCDRR